MRGEERSAGFFDRFAAAVAGQVARAWFFAVCLGFVIAWALLLPFQGWNNDVWHLWLNSPTTSVTFLLVALVQNTQDRSTRALQHKLDRLAAGLADVLDNTDGSDGTGKLAAELRKIAGVEMEAGG